MLKRASGILMHISSLPSRYGIGDLGEAAYRFADFLFETRQQYWQILPLNPTSGVFYHSPYSSPSAFAANTLLISPEAMLHEGWLSLHDLQAAPPFPDHRVDYGSVSAYKQLLFDKAFLQFRRQGDLHPEFERFCREHAFWLEDYALFTAVKELRHGENWVEWPEELRKRSPEALEHVRWEAKEIIEKTKFLQFAFFRQWEALRGYCRERGIDFIGDVPIYVTDDSADVWTHPEFFKLADDGRPQVVAGVPPDYFSKTGQRWGNPVYAWDRLKASGYAWWMDRMRHNLKLFDVVRVDHFRGFVAFWQIPCEEKTAVNGEWVEAPADDFFRALKKHFGRLPIIAEDLGIITDDVKEAMDRFGFPGMKVLLFGFGEDLATHPYIPENYKKNCVAYTGTHDNNTVYGWLETEAGETDKKNLLKYFDRRSLDHQLHWDMIAVLMNSVAHTVIIPMQDVLGLGADARMNVPGTVQGNWQWRLPQLSFPLDLKERLRYLTESAGRD